MSASYDSGLTDPAKTPYNFFVGTSYGDSIRAAMQFVKDTWTDKSRAPKVVFIFPDHPYGKNPIPAGKEMAKALGIEVGPDQNVALNATEAVSQLSQMKQFNPDYAWIGGTVASTAVIVKDAAKLGLNTKFLINVWGFNENLAKLAGDAAKERAYGMVPFTMWGDDVPGMKPILEMHKKNHERHPHPALHPELGLDDGDVGGAQAGRQEERPQRRRRQGRARNALGLRHRRPLGPDHVHPDRPSPERLAADHDGRQDGQDRARQAGLRRAQAGVARQVAAGILGLRLRGGGVVPAPPFFFGSGHGIIAP
jgi:hypothetical protein